MNKAMENMEILQKYAQKILEIRAQKNALIEEGKKIIELEKKIADEFSDWAQKRLGLEDEMVLPAIILKALENSIETRRIITPQ